MLEQLYLWRTLGILNQRILKSTVATRLTLFIGRYGNESSWCSVTITLTYYSGEVRRYYPDFYIKVREKFGDIAKYIIEVKPKKQTQPPNEKNKRTASYRNAALTYAKNQTKWSAAREYCEDRQMNFLILTEDHLGV